MSVIDGKPFTICPVATEKPGGGADSWKLLDALRSRPCKEDALELPLIRFESAKEAAPAGRDIDSPSKAGNGVVLVSTGVTNGFGGWELDGWPAAGGVEVVILV